MDNNDKYEEEEIKKKQAGKRIRKKKTEGGSIDLRELSVDEEEEE